MIASTSRGRLSILMSHVVTEPSDRIDRCLQTAQGFSDLPVSVTIASVPSPSLTGAP
jgi:hypothetical protein